MKFRSTPLPACRNGVLFDNSLNDKHFRIDIRVENGYEEGCTRGVTSFQFFNISFGFKHNV
jgi:hypothetical protein